MKKYAKWIHPQIEVGKTHKTPIKPTCFTNFFEQSVDWSFYSASDTDRTEYWEVDMTEHHKIENEMTLMTAEEVFMEVYGQSTKPVIAVDENATLDEPE